MKIYVIMASTGEYDSKQVNTVDAFLSNEKAELFLKELQDTANKMNILQQVRDNYIFEEMNKWEKFNKNTDDYIQKRVEFWKQIEIDSENKFTLDDLTQYSKFKVDYDITSYWIEENEILDWGLDNSDNHDSMNS